ncbi:MAG: hypothetical protein ACRD1W_17005 [Vicinamibacterales bacterium]
MSLTRSARGRSTEPDPSPALAALSPEEGMLYYHLLLARLESRGELA